MKTLDILSSTYLIHFLKSNNRRKTRKNSKKYVQQIVVLKPETPQAETNRFVIDSIFFSVNDFFLLFMQLTSKLIIIGSKEKHDMQLLNDAPIYSSVLENAENGFFLSFSVFKKINWIICLVLISMCFVHGARIEMKEKVNSKQKQIRFLVDRKETKRLVSGLLHCSISVLVVRWCMPITNVRQPCSTF